MSPSSAIDQSQRLTGLLQKISSHLDILADQTHVIEHAVGQHLCPSMQQQSAAITQLQSLDYLRQSLEDLAILTQLLSRSDCCGDLPAEAINEILNKLNLQDTKALVCSKHVSVPFGQGDAKHGEIDLF